MTQKMETWKVRSDETCDFNKSERDVRYNLRMSVSLIVRVLAIKQYHQHVKYWACRIMRHGAR